MEGKFAPSTAGLIAVYSQALIDPGSTAPTIGASGAVAGVRRLCAAPPAGADPHPDLHHLLRHAGRDTGVDPARRLVRLHSSRLSGRWRWRPGRSGDAYFAHVGGFLFGLAAIKLFATRRLSRSPVYPSTSSMDPDLRNALLMTGLIFCGFFAASRYVIFDRGLRFETYGDPARLPSTRSRS